MLVELQRYMYGLQESPNKFNELLTQHITGMGLTQSTADPSVFSMDTHEGMLILCVHVDDLLLTSPSRKWQQWFESGLRKEFEIVCQYDKLSYLGMSINYDKRQATIHIAQTGFARDLVKRILGATPLRKPPPSPATDSLINDVHDGIESDNRKEFLSTVMALMYLARLTRPDILFATTVLATRCARPTQQDMSQLNRVVRYVAGTTDIGLTFDGSKPLAPTIYADASHGIHHDGKGHGGIVITYGSAPVLCRSFKLKLVTRSSTESELVALEEASTYAEWLKLLMSELKIAHSPQIPIYQDNKSTIIIATCGGNFKRTKHMLIRHKFVEDQVKRGNISLKYISTKKMPADFLTKPQQGSVFAGHKARLRIQALPEAR